MKLIHTHLHFAHNDMRDVDMGELSPGQINDLISLFKNGVSYYYPSDKAGVPESMMFVSAELSHCGDSSLYCEILMVESK